MEEKKHNNSQPPQLATKRMKPSNQGQQPATLSRSFGSAVMTYIYDTVIRLSLGKLFVNLLQVVKRTNTPLIPWQMASSTDHNRVSV